MYDEERNSSLMLAWRGMQMEQVKKQHTSILFLILMTILHSTFALHAISPRSTAQTQTLTSHAAENSSLLECLQVAPPIFSPVEGCQQLLMVHTFAYSYGQPFVGKSQVPKWPSSQYYSGVSKAAHEKNCKSY
jgi:hypothetical protein